MTRLLALALALLPTAGISQSYSCPVDQYLGFDLPITINRQTGECRAGDANFQFVSSDGDFVCSIFDNAYTMIVAPDNSWAIFEDGNVLFSGRCTPL